MLRRGQVLSLLLGGLVVVLQIYTLVTPNDIFYATFPDFDKILHFMAGMALAGLIATTLKNPSLAKVLIIVFGLGFIWEVVEVHMLYDASSDSFFDMIFNCLGAVIGALLVEAKL